VTEELDPRLLRARRLVRLEPLALLLPQEHPLAAMDAVPLGALRGTQIDASAGNEHASEPAVARISRADRGESTWMDSHRWMVEDRPPTLAWRSTRNGDSAASIRPTWT